MATLPTVTAGVGLGTSPPAPTVNGASSDSEGTLNFGTGTSPTAGLILTVVLAANYSFGSDSEALARPFVQLSNAASVALGSLAVVRRTYGFDIYCTGTPAVSQAATTYQIIWSMRT